MAKFKRAKPRPLARIATGITGFDELSFGGLPEQRTTLLKGGAGSGKTVFALQSLVNTAKVDHNDSDLSHYGFLEFMVDCVVSFDRRLDSGVSLHRLSITKFRGSDYGAGEYSISMTASGMEVAAPEPTEICHDAPTERVSIGFERLDTMLGGGLFRGNSTLITGVPGTSKTTLSGKFTEAACERGERTLFVSFDEGAAPIQRNLASVGIDLKRHVESGLLRIYSGRTESNGAEDHLVKLKALILTSSDREAELRRIRSEGLAEQLPERKSNGSRDAQTAPKQRDAP